MSTNVFGHECLFTITMLGLQSDCQQEITVLPEVALKGMENTN